ncbi:MAG: 50S ribosomal protein L6 [bacterium]
MSRVAKSPVVIPAGVEVNVSGQEITVSGKEGKFDFSVHPHVVASIADGQVSFEPANGKGAYMAMAGTMRSLVNNMVKGVSQGFEKKLQLVGVGYRAQSKGKTLSLALGFSHPVEYAVPEGIKIETPSQTEIVIKGADKQLVGKVAADIRAYRPPEPYKGKGVKYVDEHIVRKDAKKK